MPVRSGTRRRRPLIAPRRPHAVAYRAPARLEPRRDPLDDLSADDLRVIVKAADEALHAARPRATEAHVREWTGAIRRWLRSASSDVGDEIEKFARQPVRRSWLRRASPAQFGVAEATWARLERELAAVLRDLFGDVGADAFADVAAETGIRLDPALREVLSPGLEDLIGTEVRNISESSRRDLSQSVGTAVNRGYSVDQLVSGVKGDSFSGLRGIVDRWQATAPPGGPADRAMTIARTELANAYNVGTVDAYRASGLVEVVNVFDGSNCGWTNHSDPQLANGMRVTLDEARAHPISHPNCQRSFGAVVAGAPPPGAAGGQVVPRPQVGPQPGVRSPVELNARAIQARVFSQAEGAEGDVTAALQALEARGLGRLEGIAYRLKADGNRTVDKILEDVAHGDPLDKAAKVNDALRYTMMNDVESYYANAQTIHDELLAAGFRPVKWKDNWQSPLSKDVNSAWIAPNGGRFELQFHTPESFHRKNVAGPNGLPASHKVYEGYRNLPEGAGVERAAAEDLLRQIWDGATVPGGGFNPPRLY